MLNNPYFYHRMIRKYVILFGNLFNNITIVRKDETTNQEIKRLKVPILYGPKEKYITRIESNPDLQRETQITLPRMSFDVVGYTYDASRKQNSLLKIAKGDSASKVNSMYMGIPIDFNFELVVYSRNIDDGTHIVEQILPYFNPDYTLSAVTIPQMGFEKDIPVVFNDITNSIQYEGNFDSVRYVYWTLHFTLKGYLYGPITQPKIISKSITNIFNDPSIVSGNIVKINTTNGNNGTFKIEDIVYQGSNPQTANAYGFVLNWVPGTGKLELGGAQGTFQANNVIRASSTNAAYTIASFDATPLKLVEIDITPTPNTAMPGDNFGYDTTITEWPNTET
jgi:hypothetical protein